MHQLDIFYHPSHQGLASWMIGLGAEGGTGPLLSGTTSRRNLGPPGIFRLGTYRSLIIANNDELDKDLFFLSFMFGLRGPASNLKYKSNMMTIRHTYAQYLILSIFFVQLVRSFQIYTRAQGITCFNEDSDCGLLIVM